MSDDADVRSVEVRKHPRLGQMIVLRIVEHDGDSWSVEVLSEDGVWTDYPVHGWTGPELDEPLIKTDDGRIVSPYELAARWGG